MSEESEKPGSFITGAQATPRPSQGGDVEHPEVVESLIQRLRALKAATQALAQQFEACAYTDAYNASREIGTTGQIDGADFKTKSHIPEMDMAEAYQFLFAHCGITGEYGSGVGSLESILPLLSQGPNVAAVGNRILGKALEGIKGNSELVKTSLSTIARKAGIEGENRLEALQRCAAELPKWVEANRDVLGEDNVNKFDELTAEYKVAVGKVIESVEPIIEANKVIVGNGKDGVVG